MGHFKPIVYRTGSNRFCTSALAAPWLAITIWDGIVFGLIFYKTSTNSRSPKLIGQPRDILSLILRDGACATQMHVEYAADTRIYYRGTIFYVSIWYSAKPFHSLIANRVMATANLSNVLTFFVSVTCYVPTMRSLLLTLDGDRLRQ